MEFREHEVTCEAEREDRMTTLAERRINEGRVSWLGWQPGHERSALYLPMPQTIAQHDQRKSWRNSLSRHSHESCMW